MTITRRQARINERFICALESNNIDRVKNMVESGKVLVDSNALKIVMDLGHVALCGYLMSKGAKFNNYTQYKIDYKNGEKKYLYA